MTHVATLIAAPGARLTDDLITRARAALPQTTDIHWLEQGVAVDIEFIPQGPVEQRQLSDHLRTALAGAPLDLAVQPLAQRRKKLLLADMDSTMIGQECIDELADMVGLKDHVSAITERAMRGEIAFEPALRERVALLKGLPLSVIDEVIEGRITLMPGARALIATMRASGAHTVLVSGGFSLFTREVAEMIGFDENHANTLLVEDGKLTGYVDEPVLGREAKLDTLLEVARHLNLPLAETIAVGDGANDLAMIGRAGLGVAFRAKPAVAAAADVRIDHGDLTTLLYLQGYRRAQFVENFKSDSTD
jgi:phosphoserine phosphatase